MKSRIVWGTVACSPLKVNQLFGRTYSLRIQGRKVSQTRNQHVAGSRQRSDVFFDPEDGSDMSLRNVG
jgi:hypothetical protein